jgi:hypothetical protein
MAVVDQWQKDGTQPFVRAVAYTKSDTSNVSGAVRAVYVGTAGNVVWVNHDDSTVTFTGVPAGTILPGSPRRINSTNTTAGAFVLLY